MTHDQILAVIAALLSGPDGSAFDTLTAGGHEPAFPVTIEACPRPLPPLDIEGQTVICGRVNVPENHDAPDGNRIDLAFAVLRARSTAPAPDALIYLHGGPGGRAVPDLKFNAASLTPSANAATWCCSTSAPRAFRRRPWLLERTRRRTGRRARGDDTRAQAAAAAADPTEEDLDFRPCLAEIAATGRDHRRLFHDPERARCPRHHGCAGLSALRRLRRLIWHASRTGNCSAGAAGADGGGARLHRAGGFTQLRLQWRATRSGHRLGGGHQCAADAACAAAFPDLEATINFAAERLRREPIPAMATRGAIGLTDLRQDVRKPQPDGRNPEHDGFIPQIVTEFAVGEANEL